MKIAVNGLERSGNTFLTYAVANSYNVDIKIFSDHKIDNLKKHNKQYPFIVPIRDAYECTISQGVMFYEKMPIDYLIKRQHEYMNFLITDDYFFIAPFNEFIKNKNIVFCTLNKKYPELENFYYETKTNEDIIKIVKKEVVYESDISFEKNGNIPREYGTLKQMIKESIDKNYIKEIKALQSKIDMLYQKYYDI